MLAGMRISARQWAEYVAEWEASGGSARAFAQEHGIAEASLRWWKSELARRSRNEPPRRSPGPTPRREPSVALARVMRDGEVLPTTETRSEVVVMLGSARIVVQQGFDPELLRAVCDALRVPA